MVVRINIVVTFCVLLLALAECNDRSKLKEAPNKLNRLAKAQSPYLQQHADNPVNWYEWGEEALAKAQKEGKPLIISIGYSSCHWCHVMERESFMDTAVARVMNENFVSIKIDREERPDIDQIYLEAAQLISGNSGWPLNAFALPDGKPIYAATYFPKTQWLSMLNNILEVYKNENRNVIKQADALTERIRALELSNAASATKKTFNTKTYDVLFTSWQSSFDTAFGGLKNAPKFPLPTVWEFLLQQQYLTKNSKALDVVSTTLDAMALGGIYDQLGGGFSRYSTDVKWRIPHFEKMLYDNAQLVSLYAHAYQITRNPLYAQIVRETLAFIKREMTSPEGGFYTSINADSEGEEGKFYVWTKDEIAQALDKDIAPLVLDYYNVTDSGNWEDRKNILYSQNTLRAFSDQQNIDESVFDGMLINAKRSLLKLRSKRIRPSTDDKILMSSNALMLKGYIDAYLALEDPAYLQIALQNAKFLEKKMLRMEGGLWHNYKDAKAGTEAFLDDYALLSRSFISLYQATFDIHWLEQARRLTEHAIKHFSDKQTGMFFYTSDQAENLIARKMELADNVVPSSNSVMAEVLFMLGEYFLEESYSQTANAMVSQMLPKLGVPYYANWARTMGTMAYKPFEVAVVGADATMKARAMQREYLPTAIFMGGTKENLQLLANKLVDGRTLIYVCKNRTCRAPHGDVDKALAELVKYQLR